MEADSTAVAMAVDLAVVAVDSRSAVVAWVVVDNLVVETDNTMCSASYFVDSFASVYSPFMKSSTMFIIVNEGALQVQHPGPCRGNFC